MEVAGATLPAGGGGSSDPRSGAAGNSADIGWEPDGIAPLPGAFGAAGWLVPAVDGDPLAAWGSSVASLFMAGWIAAIEGIVDAVADGPLP